MEHIHTCQSGEALLAGSANTDQQGIAKRLANDTADAGNMLNSVREEHL